MNSFSPNNFFSFFRITLTIIIIEPNTADKDVGSQL